MRRLLDSKSYISVYWPSEFVSEHLSVIKYCVYQKGLLMWTNLETEISEGTFSALPPIQEKITEIQELRPYFENMLHFKY